MNKPTIIYDCRHGYHSTKPEDCEHGVGLLLPWPESCPYTPEQVMAACERKLVELVSVPRNSGTGWFVQYRGGRWIALTPEFMGEPKKCACETSPCGYKCPECGRVICDRRRKGERRKGERRKIGQLYEGGRRRPPEFGPIEPRTGRDRRKP